MKNVTKYFVLVHASLLPFALSVFVTGLVTNFIKIFSGVTRPDFLARCVPAPDTPTEGLVTSAVCTAENMDKIDDGFESLPSGHASIAFAAFYFLSLWLAGQTNVFSPRAKMSAYANTLKAFISLLPILLSIYIGISRVQDYRHRSLDIAIGAVIGVIIAWICYRLYFPRLSDPESYIPYCMLKGAYWQDLEQGHGTSTNGNVYRESSAAMLQASPARNNGTSYNRTEYVQPTQQQYIQQTPQQYSQQDQYIQTVEDPYIQSTQKQPTYSSTQPIITGNSLNMNNNNNSNQSIELTAINRG